MERIKIEVMVNEVRSDDVPSATIRVYEWIPDTGWQIKTVTDDMGDGFDGPDFEDLLDAQFPDNAHP